jgi:hypothetical protein
MIMKKKNHSGQFFKEQGSGEKTSTITSAPFDITNMHRQLSGLESYSNHLFFYLVLPVLKKSTNTNNLCCFHSQGYI